MFVTVVLSVHTDCKVLCCLSVHIDSKVCCLSVYLFTLTVKCAVCLSTATVHLAVPGCQEDVGESGSGQPRAQYPQP